MLKQYEDNDRAKVKNTTNNSVDIIYFNMFG